MTTTTPAPGPSAVGGRTAHPLLIRPDDAGWAAARTAWNLAVDQRPAAIATPSSAAEAGAVVRAAIDLGLRVAPQSTGHGAATIGNLTRTILLKTSALQEISIDPGRGIARIGGGVTWGDVTAAAGAVGLHGLYGTDDSVGVAGYTLGGGMSWFARQAGLACSHVTAVELVTGDGQWRRVDADNEAELFWAVRGGGGGFGVVTALEFRLFPVVEVTAGSCWFPLQRAAELLPVYREWTDGLADLATTAIRLMRVPDLPTSPEPLRAKPSWFSREPSRRPAGRQGGYSNPSGGFLRSWIRSGSPPRTRGPACTSRRQDRRPPQATD